MTPADGGLEAARRAKAVLQERLAGDPRVRGLGVARRGSTYVVALRVAGPDGGDPPGDLLGDLLGDVDGVEVEVRVVGDLRPHG